MPAPTKKQIKAKGSIEHHVTDPPRYPRIIAPIEKIAKDVYIASLNKMVIDINRKLKSYDKENK